MTTRTHHDSLATHKSFMTAVGARPSQVRSSPSVLQQLDVPQGVNPSLFRRAYPLDHSASSQCQGEPDVPVTPVVPFLSPQPRIAALGSLGVTNKRLLLTNGVG